MMKGKSEVEMGDAKPAVEAKEKEKAKRYIATFTANRTFEAHIGGEVIRFGPYESIPLEARVVETEDFRRLVAQGALQVKEVSE